MNQINWAQVALFAVVVLVVFILGIAFLLFLFGGWGMMGPGMPALSPAEGMGSWSPGYGGWMSGILGWLLMLIVMGLPLGLFILLILGAVWLARGVSGSGAVPPPAPPPVQTCPNCGQGVQADWRICPYCEQSLRPASEG